MESNTRNHTLPEIQQPSSTQVAVAPPAKDDFSWITNEAMLRDEGALYGIAAADSTDKLQAIASYFKTRMAPFLQKKEFIQQRIQELSLVISVNNAEVERIAEKLEEEKAAPNNMLTLLFQLLALSAVCLFNFFLIQWWLKPVVSENLICLGIYLAGLFSVYIGRGLTYSLSEKDFPAEEGVKKNKWLVFLKEFAVAAAVSIFICTLTSETYPVKNSLAAAIIFFLLFLVGKVLIDTFSGFREHAAIYFGHTTDRYRLRKKQRRLVKKTEATEASLSESRNLLQEPEAAIKKLEAEQDYKTRVFQSEYHLAVESKQIETKLPSKQFA